MHIGIHTVLAVAEGGTMVLLNIIVDSQDSKTASPRSYMGLTGILMSALFISPFASIFRILLNGLWNIFPYCLTLQIL